MFVCHIAKPDFSLPCALHSSFRFRPNLFCSCSELLSRRRLFQSKEKRISILYSRGCSRINSRLPESERETNGEESPESLFLKEIKKRGMDSTSPIKESSNILEESDKNEQDFRENNRSFVRRDYVRQVDVDRRIMNQREHSMKLNSEGLEGLIPRAKLLLSLGGAFFLVFWPLILVTVAFSSALYLYFGPSFIHDANKIHISSPQYIDPYKLLEDERLSLSAPDL